MATLSDLIERVQDEVDLQDEDFVNADEIKIFINAGIRAATNVILTLNEDYLLAPPAAITLVSGTDEYSLPAGIYAQKVRRVFYNNGSIKRVVRRIKKLEDTLIIEPGEDYWYLITNDATDGFKITFYPTPAENGAFIQVYFLRSGNELSALTDVLDLPQAQDYVVQYAIDKATNKENKTPNAPPSPALMREEQLLIDGLTNRTPDDDNEIEPEIGFYQEHT